VVPRPLDFGNAPELLFSGRPPVTRPLRAITRRADGPIGAAVAPCRGEPGRQLRAAAVARPDRADGAAECGPAAGQAVGPVGCAVPGLRLVPQPDPDARMLQAVSGSHVVAGDRADNNVRPAWTADWMTEPGWPGSDRALAPCAAWRRRPGPTTAPRAGPARQLLCWAFRRAVTAGQMQSTGGGGHPNLPHTGGQEEDLMAITERDRIRQSTHRHAAPTPNPASVEAQTPDVGPERGSAVMGGGRR
jgi:hypothetical protein